MEARQHATSLREHLRLKMMADYRKKGSKLSFDEVNTRNKEEAMKKMLLIIEHQAEFPSMLRPFIAAAGKDTDPKTFLLNFYVEVKSFILGRSINPDGYRLSKEWHGLDINVDTEEEVELLIRLFPIIVCETIPQRIDEDKLFVWHNCLCFLTSSVQAVGFLPLLAKLEAELCHYIAYFWDVGLYLAKPLLCGFPGREWDTTELNETSLDVLARLIEEKRIEEAQVFSLMNKLLIQMEHRDIAFIEARVRFLVQCTSGVLEGRRATNGSRVKVEVVPPQKLLDRFLSMDNTKNDSRYVRIFEVLVELGMLHYPKALGFVFDQNSLESACSRFGSERVKQIVHEKLASVALQAYSKAGGKRKDYLIHNSKDWSADAIYMALRHDPIGVLYH